jgi:hypothetical protein
LLIQRKFNVAVEQFIWQVANEIPIQGDTGDGKKKKKEHLHLSQKLVKQHLLVKTASFITSLHSGQ